MKKVFFVFFFFVFFIFSIPACGDFLTERQNNSVAIHGTVLTADGDSPEGICVLIQDVNSKVSILRMETDEQGSFYGTAEANDCPSVRFIIEKEGYMTQMYPPAEYFIVLTPGEDIFLGLVTLQMVTASL